MPVTDGDSFPIEIFATGRHAGLDWDHAALDAMAANHSLLKGKVTPAIKVGHGDQVLAGGAPDADPALGWVENVRRVGDKLIGDVTGAPTVLKEAIRKGLYRRCSAEIYPAWERTSYEGNLKSGATGPVLSAVAVLGWKPPEVKSLQDLNAYLNAEQQAGKLALAESNGATCVTLDCGEKPAPVVKMAVAEDPDTGEFVVTDEASGKEVGRFKTRPEAEAADQKANPGDAEAANAAENFTMAEVEALRAYDREVLAMAADVSAAGNDDMAKDGSFKGGFDGCVQHMMSTKGVEEPNARKLCAYIGRQAGKIPASENSLQAQVNPPQDDFVAQQKARETTRMPDETKNPPIEVTEPTAEERIAALEAALADEKASKVQLEGRIAAAERDREAQRKAALHTEARSFVANRSRTENLRIMPAQREYAVRLYEMLDGAAEVVSLTEATELRLFAEGDKPKALTARDLFVRFVESMPKNDRLVRELSEATEPAVEDFDAALTRVMAREKLARTPENVRQATLIVATERPDLRPSYGLRGN